MRYIIRKFVDADSVQEALQKEPSTPVHDAYLKEGEELKSTERCPAIGFVAPPLDNGVPYELAGARRKR